MDLVPNSAIPELQIINSDMAPARVAAVRANVTNTIPWQSSDSIAETASQAARRIQSAYRGQLARRAARTLFEWRHFHRHITIHCNFARLRRTGIGRPRRWRSYLMWATPAVLVAARPNGDITVKTPACARTGQTLQITLPNHHVIFVRMPVGVIPGAHFVQTVGSRLLAPESKIRRCLALCANWEFRLRRAQHLRHGVFQRVKVVETSMQLRRISRLLLTTAAIVMQAHFRGRQRRTHIRSACGQLVRMEKNAIGVRTPNMRLVLRTLLNRAQKVRVSALREQVAQSAEVYVWAKVVDSDLATGSSPAAHTVPLRYWTKALAKVASSSPIISIVIDVDCSRRQIFQAKLGLLLRWLPRFRDHVMARGSGSDQPRRRIKLSSSENPAIMFLLLRFVHGHSITVSETNIIDLIMMARSYGARGEGSERMIQSMSKLLSVANCCNMLESVQLVEVQMTEKCLQRLTTRLQVDIMRFIYHNIAEVAVSQGVVNLSASALKSILLNDQLQLCDEGEILSMVLRWLQHDLRKRSTALGWICPCIRWPNVPLQLLQQHVNAALVEASFAATESARAAAAAQEATAAAESANGSNAPKDREGALRDSEWTRTYRVIAPAVARASLELDSAFIRKLEVGELVVCVEQVVLDESGVVRLQIVDTRAERDELWVSLRAADGSLLLQHQSDSSTKEDSGRRTTAYWLCGVPASVIDSMEDLRSLLDQIGEVSSVDLETVQRAATDDGKVQRVQTAQDAISHFLRDVPLFAGLSAHDFAQLTKVSFSDTRQFRRGDVIMQQGQTGHEFFLLTTGTAEAAILVPGMKEGSVVKHYVSGDYFGELALSRADSKRAATITVTSQTATCISISRDTYNSIVKPVGSGLCSSMRAETAFVVRVHFFTDRANAPSPGLLSVPQRSGSSLQLHLVDGRDDFLERALGVASQLQGAGTPRNSQVSLEHKTGVTRVPATPARFVPSFAWVGKRDGYYFSTGESGVGYYQDRGSGHWDAIAVQANKEEWLRNHVELLQPLSPPELSLVAALMQEHHFAPEEQIVTENEVGAELYILRSGVADVTKKGVAGGRPLISYESGAAFGERALVLTEPRSASVTARGPCCCYVLSQAAATNSLLANAHIQESIKHSIQMQVEAEEAQLKLVRTQQKQLESETFVQLLDNAYRSALVGNRGQPFGTTARPRQYTPLQLHQEAQAVLELHMQNMYPKSAGEAWFAVAHGWWDELCNHCALWPHCASPGPISNKALESTAGADGEGIDFIWVCQQVWDGVVSLYGGGPSMQRYSIACPRHLSIHSGPDTRTHQTKISSFVVELHTCKLRVALRSDLHVPEKPDKIAAPATNSNFVAGAGNEQNHSQPLPTNDEFVFIEVNLSHYATIRQAKRIASQRLQISSSRWLVARAWSPSLGFTAELAEGLTLAEARLFDGAVLSLEGPEVGTESVPPIPSRKSSLPRRRKSRASNSTSRTVKPSNRSPQEIVKEVDHRGSTAAELAFDATVGALFDERGPCKPWEGAQLPAVGSIEKVLAAMDARIVEQNQLKDSCVQQENFLQAEQRRQELTEWKCRRKCWRLLQLESTSLADAVSTVVAEEERQLSTFTVRVAILDNGDDAQPYACAGLSTLAQTIENSGMPATSVSDVASVIAVGGPCEAEGENAVANSQRVRSASPVWYQNLRKIGDCQAFLQCTLEVLGADTERAISRGVQRVQEMHTRRAGVAAERECMENHSITDGAGIPAEEATRLLGKARDLVASQSAEQALEVLHRAVQLAPFDTQLMHASAQLALFGNDPYCH
jgi:CRP-like cAMP-binding protein